MKKEQCQIIEGGFYVSKITDFVMKKKSEILEIFPDLEIGLAVILVGDDPASKVYVKNKIKKAQEIGIKSHVFNFEDNVTQDKIEQCIKELSARNDISGILIQMPLPSHLVAQEIIELIDHNKDVDGFSVNNVGLLNSWQQSLEPCTPQGVLMVLKDLFQSQLNGKKAVVLGRSRIVGRPMSTMLLRENCTVTSLHSHSQNLQEECMNADIVISAVGIPHLVKSSWIKDSACVIDVGIIRKNGKLYGDVDFENVKKVAGFLTPVPGGIGPITVACLMLNTIKACYQQHNIVW